VDLGDLEAGVDVGLDLHEVALAAQVRHEAAKVIESGGRHHAGAL
jgi:hypothetical protein